MSIAYKSYLRKKKTTNTNLFRCAFKKRKHYPCKIIKLIYGRTAITSYKQQKIEGLYMLKIKLKIKKAFKKLKKQHRPRSISISSWLKYTPNASVTKKSKNARMGSGRGKFVRRFFIAKENQVLIEFKNSGVKTIQTIQNLLWYKFGVKTNCIQKAKLNLKKQKTSNPNQNLQLYW